MVLHTTPQLGAPHSWDPDWIDPNPRQPLTEEQQRLVDWWASYRAMDEWERRGMPLGRGRASRWPGPASIAVARRRKWWAVRLHGWACWYCPSALTPYILTVDHLTPTSRGGLDVMANVRPCCNSCNSSKSTQTEQEYRDSDRHRAQVARMENYIRVGVRERVAA